jgi:uncharacterized protein
MLERRFYKENVVSDKFKKEILEIIKGYFLNMEGVVFAYLYGSFSNSDTFRDIDVAIFTGKSTEEMVIESDLAYELTEKTGYPVDVKVINKAPIALQMSVLRDGKLILSRDDCIRTDFIEDVGKRYREYVHFRNIVLSV